MFPASGPPIQQAPPPIQQVAAGSQRAGSRKKVALVAGVVVVGAIVAIAVGAGGGGHKDDRIDLENDELEATRNVVCECEDEKCLRVALAPIDDIIKSATDSGVKATKEQHERGLKIFDEIGACVKKASGRGPPAPSAGSDAVSDLIPLRDAMCACTTKACAKALEPKFDAWREKYMKTFNELPAEVREQALAVAKAQKQCFDALLGSK